MPETQATLVGPTSPSVFKDIVLKCVRSPPYPQPTVPALCRRSSQGDTRVSVCLSGCNCSPGLSSDLMLKCCSCSQTPEQQ